MFAEKQAELESHLTQMTVKRDQQLESIGEKPLQLKILRSLKRNWDPLTVFVSNPDIPLHNNAAERAIRPATLGRKNYYGNHSEWCGEFAAMSMSILQTAAQHNLNIQAYLRYYLDACARLGKVPEDLTNFLPWNIPEADRETLSLGKTKSS
jgi:transposase